MAYCLQLHRITKVYIKIAGRNISNLRYADDTTIMAEGEEELKNPLMKVKEENDICRVHHEKRWAGPCLMSIVC